MWRRNLIGSIGILFLIRSADGQSITYESLFSESTFARTIDLSKPVGRTVGAASAMSSGAASYNIPVICAPGSGGMTPGLAIVYNSQSGNGILGMGWTISGLSVISRAGWDKYHHGKVAATSYGNSDAFVQDGSYLYPGSGTYGTAGATYKTEAETYAVITSYGTLLGAPEYFTVTAKDGTVMQYGYTADSRIISDDDSKVMAWRVNKIQDASGNYMTFTYDNTDRDPRISKICYTGNSITGLAPYNEISFEYQKRKDKNVVYDGGFSLRSEYLLRQIQVSSEGELFKIYQFRYGKNNEVSYLKQIQEGAPQAAETLNDTRFLYGQETAPVTETAHTGLLGTYSTADLTAGDFDGDGLADFLVAQTSYTHNNTWNSSLTIRKRTATAGSYTSAGSLSFSTGLTRIENTDIIRNGYAPIPADFNGDGREDIIVTNSNYTGGVRTIDWIRVYYTDTSGGLSVTPGFEYLTGVTGKAVHKGADGQQHYFFTGDFDGDGRSDYITILGAQLAFTSPHTGVINKLATLPAGYTVSGLFHNADAVYVVHMDGDTKSDLMIVDEGITRVFTFNFNAVLYDLHMDQVGEDMTYPTRWHEILLGDFNGDGKTDVLTGPARSQNRDTKNWYIGYSDGLKFRQQPFVFDHVMKHEFANSGSYTNTDRLCIGDYNGDGKSDIYNYYYAGPAHHIYYSYGDNKFLLKKIDTDIRAMGSVISADFNGDGRADIFGDKVNLRLLSFQAFDQSHLLAKVTDGFNYTTEFAYGLLSYGSAGVGDFYAKGAGEVYPVNNIQIAMYVLTSLKAANGTGGWNTTWLGYENLRLHRAGRGMLGFEKVKSYDVAENILTESIYDLSRSFYVPWLRSSSTRLASTGKLLTLHITDNRVLMVNTNLFRAGGAYRYIQLPLGDTLRNLLTGSTTITVNQYDGPMTAANYGGYANIERSAVTVSGGPETFTTVTENTYTTTSGVSVPNKPATTIVRKTRGSQPTLRTKSIMTYNGRGLVTELTSQPEPYVSLANIVISGFGYDDYGNKIYQHTKTVSGVIPPSLWPELHYEYDDKGRFITREINVHGDPIETVTHKFWGKPLSVKGVDGLLTSHSYDHWGKLVSSTIPVRAGSSYSISYRDGWNVRGTQLYYEQSTDPIAPDSRVTYDLLQRPVKEENESSSGWTMSQTSYDTRGNVRTVTNNYYPSETPETIAYTYDDHNRVATLTDFSGVTTYSYLPGAGVLKTTIEMPDGKRKMTTVDASGKVIRSSNGAGGTLHFTYDSHGNEISTGMGTDGMSYQLLSTKEYDLLDNLKKAKDPDAGTFSYQYNAFGQLRARTDAAGKVTSINYDKAGRMISKSLDGYLTTYEYYDKTCNYALKRERVECPSVTYMAEDAYEYGDGIRVSKHTRSVSGHRMEKELTYDAYGRPERTVYQPSGFRTKNHYDANGFLQQISTDFSAGLNRVLYQARNWNGNGQVTGYKRVDGLASVIGYDHGYVLSYQSAGVQDLSMTYNYASGHMTARRDNISYTNEAFSYDDQDRLLTTAAQQLSRPGSPGVSHPVVTLTYHNAFWGSLGRIESKSDAGTYTYGSFPRNAVTSITDPLSQVSHETQNISYTPFHKTDMITEMVNGIPYQQQFRYNAAEDRVHSRQLQGDSLAYDRWYMDDYEWTEYPGTAAHLHYIYGDAGLCGIVAGNGSGAFNYYGAYTDHLGSLVAVTDLSGAVLARQSYDAWGRERDPATWGALALAPARPAWLYRGYTGHEMLPEYSLINMNGRMYDPVNARMLRPDKYLQDPYHIRNYNRYSYCFNNPLSYTDPTGEIVWAPVIIGAAVGAYVGGSMANGVYNPAQWDYSSGRTWGYMAGGAVVGGLSGIAGYSVAASGIPFANTAGIAASSFVNSLGTALYTGGRTGINVSLGFASFNFSAGTFGYLGKAGNTPVEHIGYGFGALANLQDMVALDKGIDYHVNAHVKKDDLTGHSAGYNKQEGVDISVAGYNTNPYTKTSHLGRELEYLKNHFLPGNGRHYTGYNNSGWTEPLHNVNGELLGNMTKYISKGEGLWGIGKLKYGFLYGCQSHVGRSLWAVGVPTLPINFHPWILNTQLFIRRLGIYSAPVFTNYTGNR